MQFCRHIGVSPGLLGMIAGASDFASMFATPGIISFWAPPLGCFAEHLLNFLLQRVQS